MIPLRNIVATAVQLKYQGYTDMTLPVSKEFVFDGRAILPDPCAPVGIRVGDVGDGVFDVVQYNLDEVIEWGKCHQIEVLIHRICNLCRLEYEEEEVVEGLCQNCRDMEFYLEHNKSFGVTNPLLN